MQYTTLGRTGLKVSVAGLGCGGNSRLGLGTGKSEAEAIALVHKALDLGVTFFDTAASYGTEEVLGRALKKVPREKIVIATKTHVGGTSGARAVESLEASLRRLRIDMIDVYELHGVSPAAYDHAREAVVPALLKEREKGKIRFLGVTETAPVDPDHRMVARAIADGFFDVVMVAFHMMHQSARRTVFPLTLEHGVGTLIMFAVRNIFSRKSRLNAALQELVAAGNLPHSFAEAEDPLGFLVHPGSAKTLPDAAYRFVRHERGVDVVLFGTGESEHLKANIASINAPPLPAPDQARLVELFGDLPGVGLDLPGFAGGPAPL